MVSYTACKQCKSKLTEEEKEKCGKCGAKQKDSKEISFFYTLMMSDETDDISRYILLFSITHKSIQFLLLSFFGFKSNLPFEVQESADIEDMLNKNFDGKKLKVEYYMKEDDQKRIMDISFVF